MSGNEDIAPKDELVSSCTLILQHFEAEKNYFKNFTSVSINFITISKHFTSDANPLF